MYLDLILNSSASTNVLPIFLCGKEGGGRGLEGGSRGDGSGNAQQRWNWF